MSSIGLCSKGLFFILWSELVLEGFQCVFEVIRSFSVTSKHDSTMVKLSSEQNKNNAQTSFNTNKAVFQCSDGFFTRVMFFPDQEAISGLFHKDYRDVHQLANGRASRHESRLSYKTPKNTSLHQSNVFNPDRNESNSLPRKHSNKSSCSVKRRGGALEELVLCLDGAVTSIDVCVLLLTCDRLTASLLRAKARGVRVRVLLDRSMAAVEGSSLLQLRRHCIPVRLLPSNKNSDSNTINNTLSHTTKSNTVTGYDDAALHHQQKRINTHYDGGGYNNSAGSTASASSGLMHHKFAVVDAIEKAYNPGHEANENNVFLRNEFVGKDQPVQCVERKSTGGLSSRTTATNGGQKTEQGTGNYHDGAAALVITGSFNWTWSAVTNNNENVIISNRPEMVAPFCKQFEQLWQEAMKYLTH